ncbi:MAG: isoleucine--tRNA ligase [Halobacteriales archaeon SW_9_67_24]|nr:MAG: isoleucine--tRNA ligase [Halobacteriales archaeon SW_9_67_24]
MSRFEDVADRYDPDAVEERVFDHWNETDAYRQAKKHRAGEEPFFFVDGPPYTSGAAHLGTTWNKTLKDAYIRYHRMQGYDVTDRPGFDMHGLPIETKVEENLGFENKKDIEAFGMEPFIEECKEYAEEQLDGLQADFESFGVWMDWENPYKTVSPEYMEAAWWGFARAAERGLVERGKRSITQCPRCETAIAKNEVEYHEVEDPSIYVKFPLAEQEGSLVAWTTTPWTVPANAFVAVDENVTYQQVRAERDDESDVLYLAADVVEEVLQKGRYEDYEVLDEFAGSQMLGWEYDHPLAEEVPNHPNGDGAGQVYHADYVEVDRTGLVHSAPGHGQEDFERGQELGLDVFCPVGGDGVYTEAAGEYAGEFVRDANDGIIADLDANGHLLASETYVHDYGQCWRCDTDIVFLATDQWFITVTDIKEELLASIEDSEWHPPEARDERFRNFVEDSPDWNVSRQRYWGIPVPIWTPEDDEDRSENGVTDDESEMIVVGTREELAERADQDVDPAAVDLHRPTVDDLTITEDGVTYTRVPDVFDVWLDSSVASWGTLDYPSEEEAFEELWPADLIMEAHDQTRGWFWSQLGMGTAALGEIPYDEVLMHGYANMPDGRGMSKSKGITIEPGEIVERHGADAMRLFLLSVTPQGDDMRFSWDETEEMERTLNILWNVFRFPLPYMRLDGFDPQETTLAAVEDALEREDRWVLSRLQTVESGMADAWDDFRQDRALDALLDFVVEDVSRFYVQGVRERMWEESDSDSKRAAYATFYRVLEEVVALLAPYAPFVAEEIYGTLTGDRGFDTVHMCDWPEPDEALRNPDLEQAVAVARGVEEAGSAARQQAERKLRWPVTRVVVDAGSGAVASAVDDQRDLVADRLNARRVELIGPDDRWDELTYSAEADMSVLGPAFGDRAGEVMTALNEARVEEPTLAALETAVAERTGESVDLTEEMVAIVTEAPETVAAAGFDTEGGGTVYVDTALTEDIESEGYARDVIRRIQEMRKELDLDLEERVRVEFAVADDRIGDLVREHEALIAEEVRADEFGAVEDGHRREWTVEDTTVEIAVEPLASARA